MSHLTSPARHSQWRWPAALFLLLNAAIHLYLTPEHLTEIPYLGVMFAALSAACIILAAMLIILDNALVWAASGALSLLALVAFVISRTVGLPQHNHDIGNWSEPLGIVTITVEVLTVVVALRESRARAVSLLSRRS